MRMIKSTWVFIIGLLLWSCASHKPVGYTQFKKVSDINLHQPIKLHIPFEQAQFIGKTDKEIFTAAHGQMMYPGGAASFFAAIAIHAGVSESAKNERKNGAQKVADAYVQPFLPAAQQLSYNTLWESFVASESAEQYDFSYLVDPEQLPEKEMGILVVAQPIFMMNKEQDTLSIRTTVSIYSSEQPDKLLYSNQAEFIAKASPDKDPMVFWLADSYKNLHATMHQLFEESILSLMIDSSGGYNVEGVKTKNYQYFEGEMKMFERGTLLFEDKDKVLIRTLRGWIKSN